LAAELRDEENAMAVGVIESSDESEWTQATPLTIGTWLRFMIGDREAIEEFARSRNAVWIGLLFVLSAGLAREYDGAYLLREPWHLLLPLAASLVTSLILYAIVHAAARRHQVKLAWWPGYRVLLTFYWMTAPLAWLYAVPVERFLDPGKATLANFGFLAIVSIWRVLLITRAISVWLDAPYFRILLLVLFFGNSVLWVANFLTPTPVWDVMGGIRLPERESVILNVKLLIWFYGTMSWFALLITIGLMRALGSKSPWYMGELPKPADLTAGRSMWAFAIALILAGLAILPAAQAEQARRWQAEHLLRTGHVEEGISFMAGTPREKFPPQWDPPPRTSYGESVPQIDELISVLAAAETPAWVRDVYMEKVLASRTVWTEAIFKAENGRPGRLETLISFLEHASARIDDSNWWLQRLSESEKLGPELRDRIKKLSKRKQ
jgi:hypothetical protein